MTKKQLIFFVLFDVMLTIVIVLFIAERSRPHVPSSASNITEQYAQTATSSNIENVDEDEFTRWNTYANPKLGIAFSYPAAYDDNARYTDCQIIANEKSVSVGSRSYIQIDPDNNLDTKTFAKKTLDDVTEEHWIVESTSTRTIAGEPALVMEYRFGELNRYGRIVFIHHNHLFYTLSFEAGAFVCGDEPGVFNRIEDTFKWIGK